MTAVVMEGPGWAPHGLDVRAGRFPLSVEAHLMNMTARLVPGATTVTINARYYALHGLLALEAARRGLDLDAAYELVRRSEVVVAGASILHPDDVAGHAHGHDTIKPRMEADGCLDVASLSTPQSGYSNPRWGFLGPYVGSELTLRILAGTSLEPGDRLDADVLTASFEGLFDLAARDEVALDELAAYPHLAIGAARHSADGAWLAGLLCAANLAESTKLDDTRRATIRLLARAAVLAPDASITTSFRNAIAYGDALRADAVLAQIPEGEAWRGTLFRHTSVGAWRRLCAWLVTKIDTVATPPSAVVDAVIAALPPGRLGAFLDALPDTVDAAGDPAPAEEQVQGEARATASQSLALLALGARRSRELTGHARAALVGDERRPAVLSPLWMDRWLEQRGDRPMADVAADLVHVLLDRARRIALAKMRIRNDGTIWLPTRVHERGDFLYKTSDEGSGNVGLRLTQLAGILAAVSVLDPGTDRWSLTPAGEALLDLGAAA
jgi:hypothetical protein